MADSRSGAENGHNELVKFAIGCYPSQQKTCQKDLELTRKELPLPEMNQFQYQKEQ